MAVANTAAVAALIGACVGLPCAALATTVSPASKNVTGGFVVVSSCGSLAGVGVSWTTTANVVTSVTLTSIPAGCNGASLSLTLSDSAGTSLGIVGPVTITGTSQTLSSMTGSPTATTVAAAYISVVGP